MTNPLSMQYKCPQLSEQDPRTLTVIFNRTGTRLLATFQGIYGDPISQTAFLIQSPGLGVAQEQINRDLGTEDEFLAATLNTAAVGVRATGALLVKLNDKVDGERGEATQFKKILSVEMMMTDLPTTTDPYLRTWIPEGVPAPGAQLIWSVGSYGNLMVKFSDLAPPPRADSDLYNPCLIKFDISYIAQ